MTELELFRSNWSAALKREGEALKRCRELESQVRDLTERLAEANLIHRAEVRDLTGERDKLLKLRTPSDWHALNDRQAATIRGLRDNVERLEREIRGARSYLLAMKDCPSRPTFCNCTGHTAMTNEIERQLHNRIRP